MLEMLRDSQVVLNLSGVGLYPRGHETWVSKAALSHRPVCFDASYHPQKTQFLLDAEEMGCQIINGVGMIIQQGALQIELWTGKSAPYEVMEAEVRAVLAERESG